MPFVVFVATLMRLRLQDMFNSAEVLSYFETLVTVRGHWSAMGGQPGECEKVKYSDVSCTATSMEFFDRLYECGKVAVVQSPLI